MSWSKWKNTFIENYPKKYFKPLDLTLYKSSQGKLGWAIFWSESPIKYYPSCSNHGAMNKVSKDVELWRCLSCNIGGEIVD